MSEDTNDIKPTSEEHQRILEKSGNRVEKALNALDRLPEMIDKQLLDSPENWTGAYRNALVGLSLNLSLAEGLGQLPDGFKSTLKELNALGPATSSVPKEPSDTEKEALLWKIYDAFLVKEEK
jgi:hypothetical protein